MDLQTSRPDALWVHGEKGSRFTLDGLLVSGRSVQCQGPMDEVRIRHCTLVPGWTLEADCEPHRTEASLELNDTTARVSIERTILGTIQVNQDEVESDPVPLRLADCILDSTDPEREAIGAPTWPRAHATLSIERTTVFGRIETHAIELAENSIFNGTVTVARRQLGCMRFCYVPPGSRTPRRYRCQPDLVEEAVRASLPSREAGPVVWLTIGPTERPAAPSTTERGKANLELTLEVDDPAPALDDVILLTLTVDNHGPRDAADVVVRPQAPNYIDLLDLDISQGAFVERWNVGSLAAGARATLTARVKVAEDPATSSEEPVVFAGITAYRLEGDGAAFIAERVRRERRRVRPRFNSLRYGKPAYAQLHLDCSDEISRGADDESEMGAFHDLFQPQRTVKLEARLTESVPAGMEAGVIFAS